jgi:aminoglycoside phosphotransferase (APT) family kinase protein
LGGRPWIYGAFERDAGRRLGPLAGRVRALLDAERPALLEAGAAPCLLHADFKPANVKWLPREREVLLLDWEFAWSGPPLFDLGQFLRWDVPPPFADALAASYEAAGGTLRPGWRRTAELLDLFNLVGLLDHPTAMPVRDADLLARVERTLSAPAR